MMTETAGHHKSSDTDGWHSGGSSLPFSVSDFAIKKNKPNRASVSADCPGSLRCQALKESCVQMLHLRQGRRAAEKQESTAEVETRRD